MHLNSGLQRVRSLAYDVIIRLFFSGGPTLTAYDDMMNEQLYDVNDATLVAEREHARDLYDELNQTSFHDKAKLKQLITELFGSVGDNAEVRPRFICDYGYNIHVGDNFFANFDCILLDTCPITIGDNCLLAPRFNFTRQLIR